MGIGQNVSALPIVFLHRMDNSMGKIFGGIISAVGIIGGIFAVVIGIMILRTLLYGWVLTKLWAWFMVPIFGIRPLSIPEGLGIALVVGMLTVQHIPTKFKDEKNGIKLESSSTNTFGGIFINPLVTLLVGYIIHIYFMPV